MRDGIVREWSQKFKDGRTNVHDEGGQGRKSVATDDIVQQIDQAVRETRRFTISELLMQFPEVSRPALYSSEQMLYRKVCACWVPPMLTDNHKTHRIGSALEFLEDYNTDEEDFLKFIVTGDETWILYDMPKTK